MGKEESDMKSEPKFTERKFVSPELYTAVIRETFDPVSGWWDYQEGSGIACYLSEIISDKRYFSRGKISVQIKFDRDCGAHMISDEQMRYHEQITLKWKSDDEEPSELIKIITEEFGLKEAA